MSSDGNIFQSEPGDRSVSITTVVTGAYSVKIPETPPAGSLHSQPLTAGNVPIGTDASGAKQQPAYHVHPHAYDQHAGGASCMYGTTSYETPTDHMASVVMRVFSHLVNKSFFLQVMPDMDEHTATDVILKQM